ncbi:hypothetical protein H4Q26_010738, partial [Puccinia striiformis f. sp. tritici PST-130]
MISAWSCHDGDQSKMHCHAGSISLPSSRHGTISTEHRLLHCYTKRCEQSFNRPPYHQTAPVTCGDTGLAPPCFATRRK